MNDLANIIPLAATALGVAPTTLLLLVMIAHVGAKVASRLIPDDAKGALGVVRKVTGILAADPSSRITSGVTIADAARAVVEAAPDAVTKDG